MKRFAWLFLIVAIVAGLWSAGWFYAASQVDQSVRQLAANEGTVENPQLICGTLDVTGFPFRIDIDCEQATLVADDVMVTASGVRLSAQVYNPTHVLVSARAPMTMEDAFYGRSNRLNFTSLQASARLTTDDFFRGLSGEGWRIARISVVGDDLNWVDTIGTEMPLAKASHAELQVVDLPELHDKASNTAGLGVYAVAKDVSAPLYQIGNAQSEVQLRITGLPDDIRRFGDADFLPAWQAAGGKVELARVTGSDGEDLIDATGTLGLDANHLLEGDITYTNRGIRERLAPFFNPMMLAVAAGLPQEDGTYKQAMQFSSGALRIGGIPLANLEPLY